MLVVVLMMVGKDGKQQIKTAQHTEKVQLIDDNEKNMSANEEDAVRGRI